MRSGDGLLVRVRPHAGEFSLAALRAVADVAARFGSGEIDLTNRGNLQLRGISDGSLEAVLVGLDKAGLLDPCIEAEAVRNIIVDPLSGLDPKRQNVRGLAAALDALLQRDERLWALPGKFGFSFSGVAAPQVSGKSTDIMVSADGDRYGIFLDGAAEVCCAVSRDSVIEAVRQLALAFLEIKGNDISFRRMREVVGKLGAATIFAMAGLQMPARSLAGRDKEPVPVGSLGESEGLFAIGIGLPFGRILADQLGTLCDLAATAGADGVHTGPERVLVFPATDRARGDMLLHGAYGIGLITGAGDVRLAMDVCPGSPACRSAVTDTRRDALRFARTFNGSLLGCSLHISGCQKGCARSTDASFTLVGREGAYDVIRNGCATSSCVQERVEAEDIGAAISRLIMEPAT